MKLLLLAVLSGFVALLGILSQHVEAAMTFSSGYYTNLCGSGVTALVDTCNRGCNPANGSCSSSGNNVVSYTCDGRQTECRSSESGFSTYQSVATVGCGKTVQVDVFNKTCRVNGAWTCGNSDLQDYIVWYSGDCQAQKPAPTSTPRPTATPRPTSTPRPTTTRIPTQTPRPTATPMIQQVSCNNLAIISGNNSFVPANVTLKANATANTGSISKYRFYFGDGVVEEHDSAQVSHQYTTSGNFTAWVEVRDQRGNWSSNGNCQQIVTVKSVPLVESQKSDCSNVLIKSGNQTQAPATAQFTVTGYDNKGNIQRYRLDFGDGTVNEQTSPDFSRQYNNPGTYIAKGYIQDSQGNWKGGEAGCSVPLYINTQPMTQQPSTGTPTGFSLMGIGSGLAALGLFKARRSLVQNF